MNEIRRSKPLLGTFVDISISAPLLDDQLLVLSNIAYAEIERIHYLMSFHEAASELSKINTQAHLEPVAISPDMLTVLNHALKLSALTDGIYDVTVAGHLMRKGGLPALYKNFETASWRDITIRDQAVHFAKNLKIDLGGIAKGYAVDCALNVLKAQHVNYGQICINAGGDLKMLNWQEQTVSIRHPSPAKRNSFVNISLQAASLATSTPNYTNKNSLIINPHVSQLLTTTDSVSVFAQSCMIADSLTKVAILQPQNKDILNHFNAAALKINKQGVLEKLTSF